MNERQSEIYALKNMWYGIFPNIIGVSLVVVFFAAILIILLLEHSRRQLMSDVAHELKTPLMIMQGELELAQELEQPLSLEKQSSLLDEVLRLSRLVHEVLDLSRLEAGVVGLHPTAIDIAEVVEEVVRKTHFLAEDKQIEVTLERSAEPVPILADKSRIVQALYNLMANALQYTEAGGRVQVRMERRPAEDAERSSVCISIADNGIGIAAADLPHIFNRFYRADSSRTRSSGGSGLGLPIAHQLSPPTGARSRLSASRDGERPFSSYCPLFRENSD